MTVQRQRAQSSDTGSGAAPSNGVVDGPRPPAEVDFRLGLMRRIAIALARQAAAEAWSEAEQTIGAKDLAQ